MRSGSSSQFVSPSDSIHTTVSDSSRDTPVRRLSEAFREVQSNKHGTNAIEKDNTSNHNDSEDNNHVSKSKSSHWAAVYSSLSHFRTQLLNGQQKNNETQTETDKRQTAYCTTSSRLAAKKVVKITKSNEILSEKGDNNQATSSFSYFSAAGGCWLCSAHELPTWHFRHRHVQGGYRQCRTFQDAFYSIFQWHNESINMWTHILGTLFLLRKVYITTQALFAIVFAQNGPNASLSLAEDLLQHGFHSTYDVTLFLYFLSACMFFGNVVPIASSAFCHTFYGISPYWHRFCWFTDFVGLMFSVLGVTTGYLAIAFLCPTDAHNHNGTSSSAGLFYTALTLSNIAFGYLIQKCYARFLPRLSLPVLSPPDRFPEFAGHMGKFSVFNFILATYLTWFHCPQYFVEPDLRPMLAKVALFPMSLVFSVAIFAQGGVPERFSFWWKLPPHFFDYLGHSHQWWHIASLWVLYTWLDVVEWHFEARWRVGCPAMIMR